MKLPNPRGLGLTVKAAVGAWSGVIEMPNGEGYPTVIALPASLSREINWSHRIGTGAAHVSSHAVGGDEDVRGAAPHPNGRSDSVRGGGDRDNGPRAIVGDECRRPIGGDGNTFRIGTCRKSGDDGVGGGINHSHRVGTEVGYVCGRAVGGNERCSRKEKDHPDGGRTTVFVAVWIALTDTLPLLVT